MAEFAALLNKSAAGLAVGADDEEIQEQARGRNVAG
jgi:hypothetical protein